MKPEFAFALDVCAAAAAPVNYYYAGEAGTS
jgi:hypothetical protein